VRGEIDLEKRKLLLEALGDRGESQRRAAKSSGYSEVQVLRLLRNPDFFFEVQRRREESAKKRGDPAVREALLDKIEQSSLRFLHRVMRGKVKGVTNLQIQAAKALAGHAARNRFRPIGPSVPTRAEENRAAANAPPAQVPPSDEDDAELAEKFLDSQDA
jgi:hypothetical protein